MKIALISTMMLCSAACLNFALADNPNKSATDELLEQADQTMSNPNTSPVRRIERNHNKYKKHTKRIFYRTIDGSKNNLIEESMNETDTPLLRITKQGYSDDSSAMAGVNRPGPRSISNAAMSQSESILNRKNASDFLWQWGQFLDHDLDLTEGTHPEELQNIAIPSGDPQFDPQATSNKFLTFNRSIYEQNTLPREQLNEITGWIDASNVYGSDEERANALRKLNGSGKLKTSKRGLLPFNTAGLSNAGGNSETLFLAGDVRANEQIGLTVMHTLFVREHNRLAKKIKRNKPHLSGDEIYLRARRIVAAQMQVITYNEFLPVLLGKKCTIKVSRLLP